MQVESSIAEQAESVHAAKVLNFLTEIGLPWRFDEDAKGFLSSCSIQDGTLLVHRSTNASDILHEAGHLCILPGDFRHLCQDDLGDIQAAMLDVIGMEFLDTPFMSCVIQTSDPEATAWAWAAGKKIGLPEDRIIEDDDYNGEGKEMRINLSFNAYIGINGIAATKNTAVRKGALSDYLGLPVYPELKNWLMPSFGVDAGMVDRVKTIIDERLQAKATKKKRMNP